MNKTFCPVHTASGRDGRLTRRSALCRTCFGPSVFIGCSISTYASHFDSISHSHLRAFLDRRVTDAVIQRMIDKWLKAGAVEDGLLRHKTEGSPQGGVISPCLSNVFLHHVLDEWFETEVKPRLRGRCTLVRFADDALMAFDNIVDAKACCRSSASGSHGMDSPSTPTRRASLTSAQRDHRAPAIRRRTGPPSNSLA
jgi:Reverse transcriptase (RNA-dependent DNA polymerase)